MTRKNVDGWKALTVDRENPEMMSVDRASTEAFVANDGWFRVGRGVAWIAFRLCFGVRAYPLGRCRSVGFGGLLGRLDLDVPKHQIVGVSCLAQSFGFQLLFLGLGLVG